MNSVLRFLVWECNLLTLKQRMLPGLKNQISSAENPSTRGFTKMILDYLFRLKKALLSL